MEEKLIKTNVKYLAEMEARKKMEVAEGAAKSKGENKSD